MNTGTIFAERNPYYTYRGIECLNSCIYNFLINDNQPITQSDIFFSGGGFDISYSRRNIYHIKSKQNDSNVQFIKTYIKESVIDNVLETYDGEMRTFLEKKAVSGHPLILNVSSSNLPYNKLFDRNHVVTHFINIIGIDMDNNMIKISDGCAPVTGGGCFEDWIDLDIVTDNWQWMNGRYIELNYENIDIQKIKDRAYENMIKGIKKYLHKDKARFKTNINGHQAVLKLFEDIRTMLQHHPQNSLQVIRNINQQLRMEGYIGSKRYLLEKFKEIGGKEELTASYERLIGEYDMICLKALKSVIKKKPEEIDNLIMQINRSVQEENEILREVID